VNPASTALLDHAPPEVKAAWNQRIRWRLTAHRFQVPPAGQWRAWMMQAGRGAGKTRTGAQDAVEYVTDRPNVRYAVVAPTQGDVRKTCFEGEAGILYVLDRFGLRSGQDYHWRRYDLELEITSTGSKLQGFSSEKPDRLRGPQFHRAWLDEAAAWKDARHGDALNTTFNNLSMGLRLGDARMVVTTTPKRVALIRELAARNDVAVTRGTTYDNLANLAPTFAASLLRYEGTTIGRQELMGELIQDVEGALWQVETVDRDRLGEAGPMTRIVVGVDPAGSTHTETGIVAAGITAGACLCGRREQLPHAYVLADGSVAASPDGWGRAVVETFDAVSADRIVGERNYGGDMVEAIVRSVRPGIPFDLVNASRGKIVRAEPISALYEQRRIHHVGYFPELEEEMTTFTPLDPWSPNRLDALVWAVTELGLHTNVQATLRGSSVAKRKA